MPRSSSRSDAAYDDKHFDDPAVTPLHTLMPDVHVLELFHGPTLAFKDVALNLLPHLIRLAAKKNDENREISILVATSGDTGKAALEGFKDVPGTSCTVFYPYGGVSRMQELQMATTGGGNTHVIGVKGNFDDAQTGVKRLFCQRGIPGEDERHGQAAQLGQFHQLRPYWPRRSSIISTPILQLVQKHCHPHGPVRQFRGAYRQLRRHSGGLLRHAHGPARSRRLLCASNRNNVLTDFFADGTYYTHRAFFQTMSPSMDILISSNLERLLFESTGRGPRAGAGSGWPCFPPRAAASPSARSA